MTYRVEYRRPNGPTEAHEFTYRQAAEDWAALCRAGGWEAEVVPVEPSVADLAADGASVRVVGRSEGREALLGGAERIRDLVERSSLGTPAAKAARASVSDETAARVVERAKALERIRKRLIEGDNE